MINWIKYKTEIKTLKDRYKLSNGDMYIGAIMIKCEDQENYNLDYMESFIGTYDLIPFLNFNVHKNKNNRICLTISSLISLFDYKELNSRSELFGVDYKNSKYAMDVAENILNNFINNFGKKVNTLDELIQK